MIKGEHIISQCNDMSACVCVYHKLQLSTRNLVVTSLLIIALIEAISLKSHWNYKKLQLNFKMALIALYY